MRFTAAEVVIIFAVLNLIVLFALYLIFHICAFAIAVLLLKDRESRSGIAMLLACGILIAFWLLAVGYSYEIGRRIFWPISELGCLLFIGRCCRSVYRRMNRSLRVVRSSESKIESAVPSFQCWLQDIFITLFIIAISFLFVPEYTMRYVHEVEWSEYPAEIACSLAFWPVKLLPEDSIQPHTAPDGTWYVPSERAFWAPYILLTQLSAFAIALDVLRRLQVFQRPLPRAGYLLALQILALFFGCVPVYGWLIWRYALHRVKTLKGVLSEGVTN